MIGQSSVAVATRPIGVIALTAAMLLSGCAKRRATPRPSPDGVLTTIAAASREFSARYEQGDATGQAALYTLDAVILPPGRPAIRGRAAIQAYWTLAPGQRVLEHRVTADSVIVEDRVAYDWGTFTVRGERNGEGYRGGGKYLIVWREVAPGTWQMQFDMWNAGPPAPASPSAP